MNIPTPPRGFSAFLYRIPIWIYRLNMGWIFGDRALLLNHIGRKSGKTRQAVLEIVESRPAEGQYFVISGFGPGSHWFQNIQQEPKVKIQVGRKLINAEATILTPDQGEEVFFGYTHRNPQVVRFLAKRLGYDVSHTEENYRAFGRLIPVICFKSQG